MLTWILGLGVICLTASFFVSVRIGTRLAYENRVLRRRLEMRNDLTLPDWISDFEGNRTKAVPRRDQQGRRGFVKRIET